MGIEGQDPEEVCQLCPNRRKTHESAGLHHTFVGKNDDPGAAIKAPEKKNKPAEPKTNLIISPAPDLVLRQVMLRKGLVTKEELEAMERELATGVVGFFPQGKTPNVFAEPPANT
jgi:hypothetical protein